MLARPTPALLAGLLLVALVPACTCDGDSVNQGDLNLVPLDQEWALGESLAQEVEAQIRLVDDPVVQAYVQRMGDEIADETELADRPWHFYVVDDPAVNAFALPGGHVYVHTGLITAADDPAELASVVGHEVAHGAARHGTERMVKAYGLGLLAQLILGEDPGLARQIVAELVGRSAIARFSRTDETEADVLGLRYMAAAGYDPDAMASMFETLLALRQRQPSRFERWLQTHPLTEDRIAAARAGAEGLPDQPLPASDAAAFEAVRQRVSEPRVLPYSTTRQE